MGSNNNHYGPWNASSRQVNSSMFSSSVHHNDVNPVYPGEREKELRAKKNAEKLDNYIKLFSFGALFQK